MTVDKSQSSNTKTEVTIKQLKPGMYVLAIFTGKSSLKVKSEGYILNDYGINKLLKAGVTHLVVDPTKEKSIDKIDKVLPDTSPSAPPPDKASPEKSSIKSIAKTLASLVSLEQEMGKAHKLYESAKGIQQKIFTDIKLGKSPDIAVLQKTSDSMVASIFRNQDALACMSKLRSKNDYLIDHALSVSILMAIFAKHLHFQENVIKELTLGAFLHDVGMVLVSDSILNKTGKLTADEYQTVKRHVDQGLSILEDSPGLSHLAIKLVSEHHERLDGAGYPNSLNADDISKYGKMMAIIDSYDAMTTDRVFKTSITPVEAFKVLIKESPTLYDEVLVSKFIQCLGVYPVGTLVKLKSGKLGLVSKLNAGKPLHPVVHVFYDTCLNTPIPIEVLDLCHKKLSSGNNEQIDCCIKPEEFSLNLFGFFKKVFMG